jgi:hypothetical protein
MTVARVSAHVLVKLKVAVVIFVYLINQFRDEVRIRKLGCTHATLHSLIPAFSGNPQEQISHEV